jgi:hypothetical protein
MKEATTHRLDRITTGVRVALAFGSTYGEMVATAPGTDGHDMSLTPILVTSRTSTLRAIGGTCQAKPLLVIRSRGQEDLLMTQTSRGMNKQHAENMKADGVRSDCTTKSNKKIPRKSRKGNMPGTKKGLQRIFVDG